jgi:hypothetical protein
MAVSVNALLTIHKELHKSAYTKGRYTLVLRFPKELHGKRKMPLLLSSMIDQRRHRFLKSSVPPSRGCCRCTLPHHHVESATTNSGSMNGRAESFCFLPAELLGADLRDAECSWWEYRTMRSITCRESFVAVVVRFDNHMKHRYHLVRDTNKNKKPAAEEAICSVVLWLLRGRGQSDAAAAIFVSNGRTRCSLPFPVKRPFMVAPSSLTTTRIQTEWYASRRNAAPFVVL